MLRAVLVSLIGFAVATVATGADAPPPPTMKIVLVRGTVQSVSPTALTLQPETGPAVVAAVTPKTRYATVERRTLAQIKPQDFVGITAVPGRNGHLRAEEVHIIPIVGMGEGQYPWDHHPAGAASSSMSSMTNGTVTAPSAMSMDSMTNGTVTTAPGAGALTVTYHGSEMVDGKCEGHANPAKPGCVGTAVVDVAEGTPISAIVAGTASDVKPGLAMVAALVEDDAGHIVLGSITVEKNGVKPQF